MSSQFEIGVALLLPVSWGLQFIPQLGLAPGDWLDLRPMLLGSFGVANIAFVLLVALAGVSALPFRH